MSHNRAKNTGPELQLRHALWHLGFRYRVNDKRLPGTPDIVLPKYRTVIFVHGCFWHGHKDCKNASTPKTNTAFWTAKIQRNQQRDQEVWRQLEAKGGDSSRSSLRISFGCLLDMVQIPRDKTPDGVHFRFAKEDEQWLTQWMKDNLLVYYKATPYNGQLTKMLMTALNPPLNLENTSSDIQQFRKELIELRNNLRMQVEDLESTL